MKWADITEPGLYWHVGPEVEGVTVVEVAHRHRDTNLEMWIIGWDGYIERPAGEFQGPIPRPEMKISP